MEGHYHVHQFIKSGKTKLLRQYMYVSAHKEIHWIKSDMADTKAKESISCIFPVSEKQAKNSKVNAVRSSGWC